MVHATSHIRKFHQGAHLSNTLKEARREGDPSRDNHDPSRAGMNQQLFAIPSMGRGGGNYAEVCDHIKARGVKRKIGKNQVVMNEILLSASPEAFAAGGECADVSAWADENLRWLQQKYSENLLEVHLHMDEKTPHIHAYFTPITDDLRLNTKNYATSRGLLRELQDEYPQTMQNAGFDLERGISGAGSRTTEQEYRRQIALGLAQQGIEPPQMIEREVVTKKILGVATKTKNILAVGSKTVSRLTNKVNALAGELQSTKSKYKTAQKRISDQQAELERLRPLAKIMRKLDTERVFQDYKLAYPGAKRPQKMPRNPIDLVMNLSHCSYPKAVQMLVKNYGKAPTSKAIGDKEMRMMFFPNTEPSWKELAKVERERQKQKDMAALEKAKFQRLNDRQKILFLMNFFPQNAAPVLDFEEILSQGADSRDIQNWVSVEILELAKSTGVDPEKLMRLPKSDLKELGEKILKSQGVSPGKAQKWLKPGEKEKGREDSDTVKWVEKTAENDAQIDPAEAREVESTKKLLIDQVQVAQVAPVASSPAPWVEKIG